MYAQKDLDGNKNAYTDSGNPFLGIYHKEIIKYRHKS